MALQRCGVSVWQNQTYFGELKCAESMSDNCLCLVSAVIQARRPTEGWACESPKGAGRGVHLEQSSLPKFACHEQRACERRQSVNSTRGSHSLGKP